VPRLSPTWRNLEEDFNDSSGQVERHHAPARTVRRRGPVVFVTLFTFAGLIRPGYSQVRNAVSDLGVGPNPWLLNGPLIALGVLLPAFAVALYRILGPALGTPWTWLCPLLLALPGLGFANAGVFTEAPATLSLHWMVGVPLLAIGSLGGFLATGLRLRHVAGWRGLATFSMAASAVVLAIIATEYTTWNLGFGGLLERLQFVVTLSWYVVFGWRLFVVLGRGPTVRLELQPRPASAGSGQ
jgi:hypothetical membrane protein